MRMARETPAPGRTRRNRDTEILQAATLEFSQKGYSAASLQDIADRVGILKGSLYHYIDSKESLLFRILQSSHEEAERIMAEVDGLQLPVEERLSEYLRRLSKWYLANLDRASLYMNEWRYLDGEYGKTVRAQRRRFSAYLLGMVTQAKEAGLARADLDEDLATKFILSAISSMPSWYRTGAPKRPAAVAIEIARLSSSVVFVR